MAVARCAPRVTLYDVGPRDGLQNEPEVLDVRDARRARPEPRRTGVPAIEVASFVDPRRVPQMAQAEEVVEAVGAAPGVTRAGLALNERGYERLVATGLDEVRFAFGVTESFNQRNQGASVEESLAAAAADVARAREDGLRSTVTLSVAFGCPFEGEVDPGYVLEVAGRVAELGPTRSSSRTPSGSPRRVHARSLVARVAALGLPVGGHFHNTRNTGYANALAALEAGAAVLDASIGGLGGCPFAPNATGNVATEDLVYALHREGVETGVDLDALIGVAAWVAEMLGRPPRRPALPRRPFPPSAPARSSPHLGELDLARAAAEDDLVAVLEERPLRAVVEPHGALAVPGELDERSLRPRLRARRWFPRRTGRPCGSTRRSRWHARAAAASSSTGRARSSVRRACRRARPRGRDRAPSRPRPAGRTAARDPARRSDEAILEQRERRDPGADRGCERLAEERAERLVLPGLDVTRAPVVHEHDPEDVLAKRRRSRPTRRAAADADDEPELELDVEPPARPCRGPSSDGGFVWPHGRTTGVPLTTTVPARPW